MQLGKMKLVLRRSKTPGSPVVVIGPQNGCGKFNHDVIDAVRWVKDFVATVPGSLLEQRLYRQYGYDAGGAVRQVRNDCDDDDDDGRDISFTRAIVPIYKRKKSMTHTLLDYSFIEHLE